MYACTIYIFYCIYTRLYICVVYTSMCSHIYSYKFYVMFACLSVQYWVVYATSKSDEESSPSVYDWSIPLNGANVVADRCSAALLRLYLKTSLLILSSCSFLSRSFSSRFCFRNLARRFLNQTCWRERKTESA